MGHTGEYVYFAIYGRYYRTLIFAVSHIRKSAKLELERVTLLYLIEITDVTSQAGLVKID